MAFLRAGTYVIDRQDGSVTGGSPEGRVKAIVTNGKIPENEQALYSAIKKAFDKYDIVNPQAKLGANARFTITHFRTTASTKIMI